MLILGAATLCGCAGKFEQLAKCSADENPVPALGFEAKKELTAPGQALADITSSKCGPMRPVNSFRGG
jgi:hypothetical protein